MGITNLIKKSIIKGYKLEAKFLQECKDSLPSGILSENAYKSAVKYCLNGENAPNRLKIINPLIVYGKFLYRTRHPVLVKRTSKLRNSFEEFHETYGLRLENN